MRRIVETLNRWIRATPLWPWLLLVALTLPAIWHVIVFPNELDNEYPEVVRPTYNSYPPPAYRLAEPGDTIDRIQIYIASLAIVLATAGLIQSRNRRPWQAAIAFALAAFWLAANPGPTFDRWHGLGWRTMLDPSAPTSLRLGLLVAALVLFLLFLDGAGGLTASWRAARSSRLAPLLLGSSFLYALGLSGLTDVEPLGYWTRWEMAWGLAGFACLLLMGMPSWNWRPRSMLAATALAGSLWLLLVWSGVTLTWYHRPLARFREIVPGKIFISAMPTERGLEIAQERHRFKTIVNLFPEDGPLRSPHWPAEIRFVKKHGLNYLGSTSNSSRADDFLDLTLETAQDPDAWPILIHCHGCMDRTPAWVGIYQFVVEGKPLLESFKFIEQHRGYRPKASVTLLYNRVLPRLAADRFKSDPVAAQLRQSGGETRLEANLDADEGVDSSTRSASSTLLPSLTPRR